MTQQNKGFEANRKSRQKVHPNVRQHLCCTVSLCHLFCSQLWDCKTTKTQAGPWVCCKVAKSTPDSKWPTSLALLYETILEGPWARKDRAAKAATARVIRETLEPCNVRRPRWLRVVFPTFWLSITSYRFDRVKLIETNLNWLKLNWLKLTEIDWNWLRKKTEIRSKWIENRWPSGENHWNCQKVASEISHESWKVRRKNT